MSKFTPGPWYWEADEVKGDPYNRVRYQVIARGKTVTRVYYSSYEGGLTNAEHDARLIAAAPKLFHIAQRLSALREALENGNSSAEFEVCKLAEQAQALVAKVEGEQE